MKPCEGRKDDPIGFPITVTSDGIPIYKCSGWMYWLRYDDEVFDIRAMWRLLNLEKEDYFLEFSIDHVKPNPDFYSSFIKGIDGKDFNELMKQHDKVVNDEAYL